jgi:hypothetical protein
MTDSFSSAESKQANAAGRNMRRALWLKQLHQWHWISSALCLLGMLLFSATGITLNHASQIEAKPTVVNRKAVLPPQLQAEMKRIAGEQNNGKENQPLPVAVCDWIASTWSLKLHNQPAEWSADEVYVPLPRPGGDAWLRIMPEEGEVEYELTDRGWISWLNDLHKGRHTGVAWSWFIDIFAVACLIFSITGLLILKFHAANRPATWPMVGMGVLIPVLLALLFIH